MGSSNDHYKLNTEDGIAERCTAYARFSSDLQRLASIEDQLRECRDVAEEREFEYLTWIIREG